MQYELAYHITPDLEEAAAKTRGQELETLLTQSGGAVVTSREPKKIHLSYPLAHKHYAYFGVMDFSASAEAIENINAQMKLQEGILRFMVVKKPQVKEVRALGDRSRSRRVHVAPTHKPGTTPEIKPKQEEKIIEKELADVLEKL